MRRFIFAVFALTVLAACQPATTELTEEQKAEIAAEVDATLDTLWDLFRQVDYDRGMEYWEHSADMVFVGDEAEIVMGFTTMDSIYRPFFATLTSQEVNITERHYRVMSRDGVYAIEIGTYAQTDTAGVTGPTRPFAYTFLWVRTDAGWRISSAHWSTGDPVD